MTPVGDALVGLDLPAGPPTAMLVLGHGAGGGVELAGPGRGHRRRDRRRGRRGPGDPAVPGAGPQVPPRPPVLDAAWVPVVRRLQDEVAGLPLVLGGRSSGARVACRTAAGSGRPRWSRWPFRPGRRVPRTTTGSELAAPTVPVLVVQGERDPLGIPPTAPGRTVSVLEAPPTRFAARPPARRGRRHHLAESGARMIYTVARALPGALSTMAAPQGDLDLVLPQLRAWGVDTLVSLLPPEQVTMLDLRGEADAARRAGLAFRSLPVPDFGVPHHSEFAGPLRELSEERPPAGTWPCTAGAGSAGPPWSPPRCW